MPSSQLHGQSGLLLSPEQRKERIDYDLVEAFPLLICLRPLALLRASMKKQSGGNQEYAAQSEDDNPRRHAPKLPDTRFANRFVKPS
jgi:hypothetical protein